MATRRTTMRSRTGTKLYAIRDETGQFKDIQTYKRAHSADLRRTSKAEIDAARGPIERKVRKSATDAVMSVRRSMKGAVAAVRKAANRAVKRLAGPSPARKKTVKKIAARTTAKKTARATTRKPAAKTGVRKTAKK